MKPEKKGAKVSETYKTLSDKHGVLLSVEVLAQVMDRSADGLRLSLAANRSQWAQQINAAKVRIGRRVHFRTELIAALIDETTAGEVGARSSKATTEEESRSVLRRAAPHRPIDSRS
jgi:hypothetical protein